MRTEAPRHQGRPEPNAADAELRRLNWALTAYAESVAMLARSATPEDLFSLTCRSIVDQGVYVLAMVAITEPSPSKTVRIAAVAGPAADYAEGLELSSGDDSPAGRGPMALALRAGAPYIVGDTSTDPVFAPWRGRAARWGIRSTASIPFWRDGKVIGALGVYASEAHAFGAQELRLFERLGDQVVLAIAAGEARERLQAAEAALRRERDFSDAVLRTTPGILFMYNKDQRFIRWNDNLERVLGYSASELADIRPIDLFRDEDKPGILSGMDEVYVNGEATREADLVLKDGSARPYFFTGVNVMVDGEDLLVGTGIDFTERKMAETALRESEARYRTLFERAPDGILVSGPGGPYVDANPSMCRMLGYDRDALIGADATLIVAEADLPNLEPARAAVRTRGTYRGDWTYRRRDGSTFPAEVVATANPSGNIMIMVRDISERRAAEAKAQEAERAVRQMQAELARFGRLSALGEFAATLAHEVKQPLAAIAANCDAAVRWLAAEPPNLDRVRQALTRMIRDWTRANDVIARTSAFAMRGDHEFSDVDLNDAIGEIVRMTAEERRKAGVQMAETLLVDLPPVRGARIELQQVILNLFMNGIEAMQAVCGRQRVLSVRTEIKPPGLIRVSVQDTGSGFDAATAERLFETFFTTKAGGTGLGLRISRSIVEAHGGHLWASQAEPQGALFQFELPTAERAAKDREHG